MLAPIFVGHGSPMMAVDDNACALFLESYGKTLRPKAIVLFTAHWESRTLTISSVNGSYDTIYDFGGFPPALYEIKYPAPGSPELAQRVASMLQAQGIESQFDTKRGLDHGSWVVLSRLFPAADIPVVQVSVNPFLPPEAQYRIGEALRGLGGEDILVVGSGATVHNFRTMNPYAKEPDAWAVAFDDWLVEKMRARDLETLFRYEELASNARIAVPRPEHFVPLYIAFGSADPSAEVKEIHRSYEMGALSYLSLAFGP